MVNEVIVANGGDEIERIPDVDVDEIQPAVVSMDIDLDRRANHIDKAREIAIKHTKSSDWVLRTGKDGKVTASLMGCGAERMALFAGVEFSNLQSRRVDSAGKDGKNMYKWIYEAIVKVAGVRGSLPVMGTCSSNDEFFATIWVGEGENRKKELKPASEVDETNIMKSALTNLYVNGITRILGIRAFTVDDLEKLGLKQSDMVSVLYGKGKVDSNFSESDMRVEVGNWLLLLNKNDKLLASQDLIGRTTFTAKDGKIVQGKKSIADLTDKQLSFLHQEYKKWLASGGKI